MIKKVDFSGIIPPIPTPFENGMLACEKLTQNVVQWSKTGVKGLLVLGSNGEYPYLSETEKRKAVKAVVDAASDDMVVLVGSGCESTAETIRLTRDCADLGAHAALVITPFYYSGKMTPSALENHFIQVAVKSPIPE